ncbi:MAG: hypothetical protein LAP87_25175 [Acidobacteriia bacterium]|nr:hypothetical protein [Terriglobia bacterium]
MLSNDMSIGKLALSVVCVLTVSCMFTPGGGGSTQSGPDSVKAGEPIVINLELSVWGSGGSIDGRYKDIVLFYRCVGDSEYKTIEPRLISRHDKSEVYEFTVPAVANETSREVEYYLEMKLDGHLNRIEGIKKIRIDHS